MDYLLKGWVARDSREDPVFGLGLILHSRKPTREGDAWSNNTIWMHLPWEMFPELKWEDEPMEVEIKIGKPKIPTVELS